MKIKLISILILLISFNSCSEDSITNTNVQLNETDFKYPYKLNSLWYYTTKNFLTDIRPDSVKNYFSEDTIVGYGAAGFVRDTIINSDTLKLLRNTHNTEGHSHSTLEFYKQSDSGLIRIAYFSNGANFGPFRSYENLKYTYLGKTFNSVNELKYYYESDIVNSDTALEFDDPPVLVLKYPIQKNVQWDLRNNGTTRTTKKYTDYESVTVTAGTFYCIKVKREIHYNSNMPDPNYIYYDYFSKDGMIKRELLLKNVLVSNNNGVTIGYIDIREETFLNIYLP